jgi:WD40 repeat protein
MLCADKHLRLECNSNLFLLFIPHCFARLAVLRGHSCRVNDCVSDVSGKLIVSVSWDTNIKLWNGITGEGVADMPSDQ